MLKNINPILNADVLYALRAMGHGACSGHGLIGRGFCLVLHLYSGADFKLNRAAALAEWCQLLSA